MTKWWNLGQPSDGSTIYTKRLFNAVVFGNSVTFYSDVSGGGMLSGLQGAMGVVLVVRTAATKTVALARFEVQTRMADVTTGGDGGSGSATGFVLGLSSGSPHQHGWAMKDLVTAGFVDYLTGAVAVISPWAPFPGGTVNATPPGNSAVGFAFSDLRVVLGTGSTGGGTYTVDAYVYRPNG